MAIISSFQTLTSSFPITCLESLSFTQFYPKLTFNYLRKSYKPIRIDSGSVRLDHPAIGKLFAAKENSVMEKLLDEEPTYLNDDVTKSIPVYIDDSQKTLIKDAGHASGLGVKAKSRHVRMSVFKVQRVIDQIRGLSYEEALMILELMPYRACFPVLKLVYSAGANARHNMGWNEADLFISKVEVNGGPTIKRSRPRARGQSYPIRKPTCHVKIVLKDKSKLF